MIYWVAGISILVALIVIIIKTVKRRNSIDDMVAYVKSEIEKSEARELTPWELKTIRKVAALRVDKQ